MNDYLPLYLWFNNNKRNGHNSFWRLLEILSRNIEGDCVDEAVLEVLRRLNEINNDEVLRSQQILKRSNKVAKL